MKMKFLIPSIGDTAVKRGSSFLVKSNTKNRIVGRSARGRLNKFGEYNVSINTPHIGTNIHSSDDPLLVECNRQVKRMFFIPQWSGEPDDDFITYVTFKYSDGGCSILLRKESSSYFMNGTRKNQVDIISALSKIILFGANNRSCSAMEKYMDRCINYPENVNYALENRMPYHFYELGNKFNVRINMSVISSKEVALELGDGIWGSLNIKDANTLIDSYRYGRTRSTKWANISPKKLWTNIMKVEPSESELVLMQEWLKQNRTSVMVENKAKELLVEISDSHEELFLIRNKNLLSNLVPNLNISKTYDFSMLVRGDKGDWLVYPTNMKAAHQAAKCVLLTGKSNNELIYTGPYCIDNLHSNSSLGDQIASRAMILKNDRVAKDMIHTLRNVPATNYRLDANTLTILGETK